jgi:hypothetical protein
MQPYQQYGGMQPYGGVRPLYVSDRIADSTEYGDNPFALTGISRWVVIAIVLICIVSICSLIGFLHSSTLSSSDFGGDALFS